MSDLLHSEIYPSFTPLNLPALPLIAVSTFNGKSELT